MILWSRRAWNKMNKKGIYTSISIAKETHERLINLRDSYVPQMGEGKVSTSFFLEKLMDAWEEKNGQKNN